MPRGPATQEGLPQVGPRILQKMVRQHGIATAVGEGLVLVVDDLVTAPPTQPLDGLQGVAVPIVKRVQEFRERAFTLASNRIINIRGIHGHFRVERREVATPDNRRFRGHRSYRERSVDTRCGPAGRR